MLITPASLCPAPEQEDRERRDEKNVLLFGLDLLELVTIVVLIIVAVSVVTAVIAILLCLRSKRCLCGVVWCGVVWW